MNKISPQQYNAERLSLLLNDSLQTFYWIGFILADGYFCENKKSNSINFGIELSEKDQNHLLDFITYLNYPSEKINFRNRRGGYKQVAVNFTNKGIIPKIMEKYNLNFKKSYNPPDINLYKKFTNEQIFSLIIGFIDGDGSIIKSKNCNNIRLCLENHKSYEPFYRFIQSFIYEYINPNIVDTPVSRLKKDSIRTNNRGYVCMCFSKSEYLISIGNKIKELNLSVLNRKWYIIKKTKLNEKRIGQSGKNHPLSKNYKIISPNNDIYYISGGLVKFVKKHNLSMNAIKKYMNKGLILPNKTKKNTEKRENSTGWQVSVV